MLFLRYHLLEAKAFRTIEGRGMACYVGPDSRYVRDLIETLTFFQLREHYFVSLNLDLKFNASSGRACGTQAIVARWCMSLT